ncbi:hypothetical protein GCM10022416_30010 [Actinomadura keratinilytica]|uniref:Uncharacterized protein n=1 Tax=Actinomadura keratinilytica TaxID=547461 RepID=A0ABP7YV22_9ACTN
MTVAATVTRVRSDHSDSGGQRSRRRGMRGALPSPTAYDWLRRRVPEGRGPPKRENRTISRSGYNRGTAGRNLPARLPPRGFEMGRDLRGRGR